MFRHHRDLRFSREKSPYKTTTYGLVIDRPDSLAGLYAQLSATGFFARTGYHELGPEQLASFRDAVADDAIGPALEAAVRSLHEAGVETFGDALKTAPRGHPQAVAVARTRELPDHLPVAADQADIDLAPTEIQPSVHQ
jgi:uncharacterized protein (DUF2461 family)